MRGFALHLSWNDLRTAAALGLVFLIAYHADRRVRSGVWLTSITEPRSGVTLLESRPYDWARDGE